MSYIQLGFVLTISHAGTASLIISYPLARLCSVARHDILVVRVFAIRAMRLLLILRLLFCLVFGLEASYATSHAANSIVLDSADFSPRDIQPKQSHSHATLPSCVVRPLSSLETMNASQKTDRLAATRTL